LQRRTLLAQQQLFSTFTEEQLDRLAGVSRLLSLPARAELCHKGDPGEQIYLIVSGRLKASATSPQGGEVVFSIMGPGEVAGEISLFCDGRRRTATMVAMEETELVVLDRRDFVPFLRAQPDAAIQLLEVFARRLERISELVEDTQFLNLPSRLAKKLLSLAHTYGVKDADGSIRIDLRLSQGELGELVATSRESVNKQIRAWSEQGIVTMEQGFITIHKRAALESLADLTTR